MPQPATQDVSNLQERAQAVTAEQLAARAKLAASKRHGVPRSGEVSISTAETMLAALDIPAEFNPRVISLLSPHEEAAFDVPRWGAIRPQKGDSLMVLSTGRSNSGTIYSEPGSDFGNDGTTAGDTATFTIQVDIPEGINRFSFDYNFLSAEYPDFINSIFNDTFTVRVTDANGTRSALAAPVTVNSTAFQPASDAEVGRLWFPFRLYVDNALGVDTAFDTGVLQDAGITGFQRVVVEVADDGPVTIEFDIRDLGDGLLDSAVAIDNLSFVTVAAVDPVPLNRTNDADPSAGMIDVATSRVTTELDLLVNAGRPTGAVAADGVTQLLLRAAVPGPGIARFEMGAGEEVGRLTAHDGADPRQWETFVEVPSVEHEGKFYAFALYQSPANFVRPGSVAEDNAASKRSVSLSMTHLPGQPGELRGIFSLEVVRRPVVVVHDLWSSCTLWQNAPLWKSSSSMATPEGTPNFLHIKCNGYDAALGLTEGNIDLAVADAIEEVLLARRNETIAATQVDLVGHGVGGILARLYLQRADYKNRFNFEDGDVNRLITLNTPHSGARMACEIKDLRNFSRERGLWESGSGNPMALERALNNVKIRIDDADGQRIIDDLSYGSPALANLTQTTIPSHAMYSAGALDIPAAVPPVGDAQILLRYADGDLSVLYARMTQESRRASAITSPLARQASLYGRASKYFCNNAPCTDDDQHDFFARVDEQKGGLNGLHTTAAPVLTGSSTSTHALVNSHPATSSTLSNLLGQSNTSTRFASSFPAPNNAQCPATALMSSAGPSAQAITQDLEITSPATGTVVTPGTSIPIVVQATNGFQPFLMFAFGNGGSTFQENPTLPMTFDIPANAIGTISLRAFAYNAAADIAFSQEITLNVNVATTLNEIEIEGGNIALQRPGRTRQLKVIGTYSDGVRRDLTSGRGTEYGVSNAGAQPFASVTSDGLVTALRSGTLTISARNGNRFTSVSVKVGFPACGDGVLDPGEECDDGNIVGGDACTATCELVNGFPDAVCSSPTVCTDPGLCSANVTTLGAGSTDPNNDPLTITQTPAGPYGVGDHNVTVRVSDGQSTDSCLSSLDVNDCELPQLACAGDFSVECTGAGGATITPPGATASDNCGVDVDAPAAGHRNLGQHALAYTATDPSGNQATCSTQVTVADTTSPVITCPAPSVAECTGNGRAQVNPGNGSATDVCTVAQVTGPGAGSFPVGVTPLTYTATDLSGNQATCSTQVTVRDTQRPTISCPALRVAECTGNGRATVDPGDATANDTCALASLTDPGPTSFPLGVNQVSYTATDLGGNQASCSTQVTVRDTAAPRVTVAGATPLWPVNSDYRTVSLADCGIAVTDTCTGAVPPAIHQAQITCVTSDEPDNAPGPDDGDTTNDIVIVNANTVRLRAEHSQSGDGRFYSIYFRVVDAAGNITRSMCPVRVVPQGCPAPGSITISQPGDCDADDSGGKFSVCR